MTGIGLGILLMLGGIGWAGLVITACGMSSRPTTSADSAPAWLGVIAFVVGVGFLIAGIVDLVR